MLSEKLTLKNAVKLGIRPQMKRITAISAPLALSVAATLASCSSDKSNPEIPIPPQDAGNELDSSFVKPDSSTDAEAGKDATGQDATIEGDAADAEATITRGEFAISLAQDVMGYAEKTGCTPKFTDVTDNKLCSATNIIAKRTGAAGNFNPNGVLNRADMWKLASQTLGFLNVPDSCQNIPASTIGSTYAGAFCRKGISISDEQNTFNPADTITPTEWDSQKQQLSSYLAGGSSKLSSSETAYTVLLKKDWTPGTNCTSVYPDVANNSPECAITNALVQAKALDANNNFNATADSNWAEAAKIVVECSTPFLIPDTQATTFPCSQAEGGIWYGKYAEVLCTKGYVTQGSFTPANAQKIPTKQAFSQLSWNVQMDRDNP